MRYTEGPKRKGGYLVEGIDSGMLYNLLASLGWNDSVDCLFFHKMQNNFLMSVPVHR